MDEPSILKSIKKVLGIGNDDDSFDVDIVMHINSAFVTLNQLGVGPEAGFSISDDSATWNTFLGDDLKLNSVKSYMYLKVKSLFDPPTTSFLIKAYDDQIQEFEWRLNLHHEVGDEA